MRAATLGYTESPSTNVQQGFLRSWFDFWMTCECSILLNKSGCSKSSWDLSQRAIKSSAGEIPVFECGVIQYLKKNFINFSTEPCGIP